MLTSPSKPFSLSGSAAVQLQIQSDGPRDDMQSGDSNAFVEDMCGTADAERDSNELEDLIDIVSTNVNPSAVAEKSAGTTAQEPLRPEDDPFA